MTPDEFRLPEWRGGGQERIPPPPGEGGVALPPFPVCYAYAGGLIGHVKKNVQEMESKKLGLSQNTKVENVGKFSL